MKNFCFGMVGVMGGGFGAGGMSVFAALLESQEFFCFLITSFFDYPVA